MLKSFIYHSSTISTCLRNNIIKRTFFNTTLVHFRTIKYASFASNSDEFNKNGQKRSRQTWSEDEDKKLKELVTTHGFKYTLISKEFPNRSVPAIYNRCRLLYNDIGKRGPWTKEELTALKELTASAGPHEDIINWEDIQQKLPYYRTIPHIKLTWDNRFNPRWHRGKWSDYEITSLRRAIDTVTMSHGNDENNNNNNNHNNHQYGHIDWHKISAMVGSRSPTQCLERWRWQESPKKKGPFTPEEDQKIIEAVKKYGDKDFLRICIAIQSPRSPRHLSHRYRYALDPNVDRSPWTADEEMKIYELFSKYNGSMLQLKKAINSKRNIKDMWNHYKKALAMVNEKKGSNNQTVDKEKEKEKEN